ncbi:MAG: peptide ABC transporter substrate-binding protein [Phycisphaerales bacterium]|nr:peptide ABC transporter substrate-binding protein [Phycisphaerales bacterium]
MRYLVIILLLMGAFAGVWYFSAGAGPEVDFTYCNGGIIGTLDPAAMSWHQDIHMALNVWEGLYAYDPRTILAVPASSFPAEISDDRCTYTFSLRPEARWSNGDLLTAEDFVYGWRRAMEPGTARDYAFFFEMIEGVREYVAWRLAETERIGGIADAGQKRAARDTHLAEADRRFAQTVGIRAEDEKTLSIRLTRPVAYFLDLCAFATFLPVHRESIHPYKIVGDTGLIYYDEQWVKPGNTHYNGPFKMTEWKFKQHILLEKNPLYWNRSAVRLNRVMERQVEDGNTAWLLYSGGQLDWLSTVRTVYAPTLVTDSSSPFEISLNKHGTRRNDIHAHSAFGTYFYNFNCRPTLPDGRPNPFVDPRVRRAFTMAVDKQSLVDQVIRLGNPVATAFVPPETIPGYPEVAGLPYDPSMARALLAEAGFPEGRGFPEVVILYNTGFDHGLVAEAIIGMWSRTLGVTGRIEGKEGKTFLDDKKNARYIIARAGWFGDYNDPTTFLEMFKTDNGNNDSKFSDPVYDRMLEEADPRLDEGERLAALADVERYLVEEALPLLPLYNYVYVEAFDPDRVRNLHISPRQMSPLWPIEVLE